ncbi:hypothetical protein KEM60_00828 [Austwickia sp. TVS 96-490-7B]|uniref:DUF4112 domain-containing protein n=1 Tax=Austwickia sp. TVS 96-490-7B TaxID=2830843 RepID=UPI001C56A45D|nr:DUF4112 domain-containing protein [Austwickia sp. TVS 96-490-7B]MBW3084639.1 hypothetical protein [Austwickia sp. TVS 96-490-7B]
MLTGLAPPPSDSPTWRRQLVWLLDDLVPVPGTKFRFGLDALIGLIPGVGDSFSAMLSIAVLIDAIRHRIPVPVLLEMGWNLIVDTLLGLVPFIGDLADAASRANVKNLQLLERALVEGQTVSTSYGGYLGQAALLTSSVFALSLVMATRSVWWLVKIIVF